MEGFNSMEQDKSKQMSIAMILFLNSDGEIAELWQSLKINLGLKDIVRQPNGEATDDVHTLKKKANTSSSEERFKQINAMDADTIPGKTAFRDISGLLSAHG